MLSEKVNGWIVCPLEDRNVSELVLPRKHVKDLRRLSKNKNESLGLLQGITRENSLYLIGYLILGHGDKTSCGFNPDYIDFYNEYMRRAINVHRNLTSILYHNHPLLKSNDYPSETIEILMQEIKAGIFDYLRNYGLEPTLDNVISEQSRQLSNSDIAATFGRLHVLLTDTAREGSDFQHINAYKFDTNSLIGLELFKIVPLSDKSEEIRSWVGGVCASLKKIYEHLAKEYKKT